MKLNSGKMNKVTLICAGIGILALIGWKFCKSNPKPEYNDNVCLLFQGQVMRNVQ